MEEDIDGLEEISKSQTYAQFLDSFVTEEDKKYLEDEELARDVKELYSLNKGEIRSKADFDMKKKEMEESNKEEENIELKYFSEDMKYKNGTFLAQLKQREKDIQSGQKSTIIFVRYKDKKGVETSAYIDFRERLKDEEEMNGIFKEGRPLLPKPTDLSYYNWTLQKVNSTDSNFFRVDAGPKERLSFKNNTNRKIINVDLEYLESHPGLDIKRIPIMNNNRDGTKDFIQDSKNSKVQVTHVDVMKENSRLKKVNKKKMEKDNDNNNWGYQQIVIFDYEQKKYN